MVKLIKITLVTFLCLLITFCSTVSIAEARNISTIDQHHVFPQQFRPEFEKVGINIDDYALRIPRELHQAIHNRNNGDYNNLWEKYFQANPNATKSQMFLQMQKYLYAQSLTGRQQFYKYSLSSVQKTSELIVKHPVWILRFAGNIGEAFVKLFGGTSWGNIVIAFLASVGSTVLGWFGIKAENHILVGVGIIAITIGLALFVCTLYLAFLIYNWIVLVAIPIILLLLSQITGSSEFSFSD